MTNDEAREILKRVEIAKPIKFEDYADMREAIDMAIKALETASCIKEKCAYCPHCEHCDVDDETLAIKALEPCEDCISRAEAIEWMENIRSLNRYYHPKENDDETLVSEVISRLKQVPSVTPQQTRWIPTSEKLPEDYIHVLCQFTLGGMGECYLAHGVFHIVGGVRLSHDEIIAWMPLPSSYQGE